MATFSIVILPAKKIANGKHKIRIMVSHNSQTRYLVTNIIIDSESEIKNGKIIRRPDKDMLNLQAKKNLIDTSNAIWKLNLLNH